MSFPLRASDLPAAVATALVPAVAALSLSACYVVPLDPRTGQPYPVHSAAARDPHTGTVPHGVTLLTPPVAPAPPQASVLSVRLYPLNTQANKGGMLTAVVVDNNAGRGTFSVSYQGDALQGEASRVEAGYSAFGRVHHEVLGPSPRSFQGRRGIANAYGAKGVNVQCEYLVTGPAMGTGACLFSDGAKYQMHFGS